jgi:hypothetical protein
MSIHPRRAVPIQNDVSRFGLAPLDEGHLAGRLVGLPFLPLPPLTGARELPEPLADGLRAKLRSPGDHKRPCDASKAIARGNRMLFSR